MKIEFGCGETPTKEGYKTCDIRSLDNIDFVCPAWEIDTLVDPNSVDEIFSRHFFEHLTFAQGELVLEKWKIILKPGGICEMLLPNMTFHINQWQRRETLKEFDHSKAGFWGWQRGDFSDTWDVHKSGYDHISLEELLKKHKFVNIKSKASLKSKNLHYTFEKGYENE